MEAANNQNQNRKRTRDDGDNPAAADILKVETKKQESYNVEQRRYDGVFDFPWLKEGVVFNAEEDDHHDHDHDHDHEQDKFGPCSYDLDDHDINFNIEESQNNNNNYDLDDEDDELQQHRSLMADDLDCIWSCVIDHPLDVDLSLPFNKGS